MTPQAREIINTVAAECGVAPALITSQCRTDAVFYARCEVSKRLRARGYTTPQIGKLLNHDHTTIVFYLGLCKKKPTPPRWRAPKIKHLNCFCRLCYFPALAPPKTPKPQRRYLTPYAGADMNEYVWRERAQ
jgi:hypothetical protein